MRASNSNESSSIQCETSIVGISVGRTNIEFVSSNLDTLMVSTKTATSALKTLRVSGKGQTHDQDFSHMLQISDVIFEPFYTFRRTVNHDVRLAINHDFL